MKRQAAIAGALVVGLMLSGCGSNPRRTHEGPLLDDDVLQQRVEAALRRAGPEFNNVRAQARDGVVTLAGTVPSDEVRPRAERIARGVYLVQDVQDELQVAGRDHR